MRERIKKLICLGLLLTSYRTPVCDMCYLLSLSSSIAEDNHNSNAMLAFNNAKPEISHVGLFFLSFKSCCNWFCITMNITGAWKNKML